MGLSFRALNRTLIYSKLPPTAFSWLVAIRPRGLFPWRVQWSMAVAAWPERQFSTGRCGCRQERTENNETGSSGPVCFPTKCFPQRRTGSYDKTVMLMFVQSVESTRYYGVQSTACSIHRATCTFDTGAHDHINTG